MDVNKNREWKALKQFYGQLYVDKFENLEDIDHFLDEYNLAQLT